MMVREVMVDCLRCILVTRYENDRTAARQSMRVGREGHKSGTGL